MTTAKKRKPAADDMPSVEVSKMKRGPSRHAGKRLVLPLAGVRAAVGKTQVDVAAKSGLAQGDVSRLEARDDIDEVRLATLRRYIEGLGGELELVARFGDHVIHVTGESSRRSR